MGVLKLPPRPETKMTMRFLISLRTLMRPPRTRRPPRMLRPPRRKLRPPRMLKFQKRRLLGFSLLPFDMSLLFLGVLFLHYFLRKGFNHFGDLTLLPTKVILITGRSNAILSGDKPTKLCLGFSFPLSYISG